MVKIYYYHIQNLDSFCKIDIKQKYIVFDRFFFNGTFEVFTKLSNCKNSIIFFEKNYIYNILIFLNFFLSSFYTVSFYIRLIFKQFTFDFTPQFFYQTCPLRIYIEQYKNYELAGLAVLTGKTEKHYEFAFNALKENINQYKVRQGTFYPTYIHIDKELTILNTIKKVFPQTKIRLCYFHLI